MADSQDLDGDSQMGNGTSPSSDSEDAMFPAANAVFPAANAEMDLNVSKSAEVMGRGSLSSPPDSQQQSVPDLEPGDLMEDTANEPTGFGKSLDDRFVPGASWNNKKAKDEWQRSWAALEDKNFTLQEFGDPFDETQPENRARKS